MTDPAALLDALTQHYTDRLTPWEVDFVNDMENLVDAGRLLSPRRLTKLEEIFDRVSQRGRDGGQSG